MTLALADHPLVTDAVLHLRDQQTQPAEFRILCHTISRALALVATATLDAHPAQVTAQSGTVAGYAVDQTALLLVPVLRAGLALLPGFTELLPAAAVAPIGLRRDEQTLAPQWYLDSLPTDLSRRHVILLDPMLATGGSLGAAVTRCATAAQITVVAILAAPAGLDLLHTLRADIAVVVAALDDSLDSNGYIVPGLGDAGDRWCGI